MTLAVESFARSTATRFLAALAYRDYRTMWYATMSAGAAAWALIVARGALTYSLSESSALVGVVTFAALAPQFVVPFLAGYLADRFDRRRVLAGAFGVNVAQNLVLAVLAFQGSIEIWHIIALSLVNGVARSTQMPTAQSLVPNLVPHEKLLNAVALNSATMQASRLVGPLLIAPLLALVGIGWSFLVCGVLYLLSLLMTTRIRTPSTGVVDASKGTVANFLAGFSYVYSHPLLLSIVLLAVLHCALTMSFESMIPVLATSKLAAGREGFAYLMMGVGTGALVTVVLLAGIQNESVRGQLLLWLGIVSGLGPVALALSTNLPSAWSSAALMGGSQAGFMTLTHVLIQTIVPDAVRGRVSSIFTFHVGGMMAAFNLINGTLADVISAPAVLTATGTAFVVIMGLSLLRSNLRVLYVAGLGRRAVPQAAD